jgi:cytochrome c5
MKRSASLTAIGLLTLLVGELVHHRPAAAETGAPSEVHTITLPTLPPDLPAGPNRDLTVNRCTLCHSTRIITMQPNFSREAWTAEVKKMRTVFGAPVAPDDADAIVDYLMSIRGK